MAPPVPSREPETLVAGDTAKWQRSLADYPASAGWVLNYTLVNAAQRHTFSASASGDDHLVTVPAATTAGWAAGTYKWRAQASKAGEVFTVGDGTLVVEGAFGAAAESRTKARIALDNLEAYLADSNNLAAAEYQIAGRSLKRHSITELLKLKSHLQQQVRTEEVADRVGAGLPDPRRVYVRFGPPQ